MRIKAMHKGTSPAVILIIIFGLSVFVIYFLFPWIFGGGPNLYALMDFITGKQNSGEETPGELVLKEAILCAYYRCAEGCESVDAMNWENLGDPNEQRLICCMYLNTRESAWETGCSSGESRTKPSDCGDQTNCDAKCKSLNYESGQIIGDKDDSGGYCSCSGAKHYCPCSTTCGATDPIPVRLAESVTIRAADPFTQIIALEGGTCGTYYKDYADPPMRIWPVSINVDGDIAVEGACNNRYCNLKSGTYYIYSEMITSYIVQIILCGHNPS